MKKILRPVAVTLCAILGGVSLPSCDNGGMEEVGGGQPVGVVVPRPRLGER